MASPALTVSLDQWQTLFQKTMEALQRAQDAVKRQIGFFGIVNGLWRAARVLKDLNAGLKVMSELPDGIATERFIQSQMPGLHKLLKAISDLIDTGKQKGLMNRTVTAASLGLISVRGEYIADYLDSLEMSIDPEIIAAIHEGRSQIERGEFEVMERLF